MFGVETGDFGLKAFNWSIPTSSMIMKRMLGGCGGADFFWVTAGGLPKAGKTAVKIKPRARELFIIGRRLRAKRWANFTREFIDRKSVERREVLPGFLHAER